MNESIIIGKTHRLMYREQKFLQKMNQHLENCSNPKNNYEKEWKKYIQSCKDYLNFMREFYEELLGKEDL